ncbi:MAG: biopolymer transporter ExbD [Muribaculaceae bacterium]|nr:biopolymer transporter ExbD [Muribaculaceae bacterium]MDE6360666.1 biopolymer transporter ExbD [Muribaculaceae bacterium]
MGKVKIKRKSTLIDMTAMSDVTVLLLTFFMLTSTFLQKEPVTVITPSSVSEIKVPTANVVNVLVSPKGQIFLSLSGDADADNAEQWGSEPLRKEVLKAAASRYEQLTGKKLGITAMDIEKFAKNASFGVPLEKMHEFLSLDQTKQDEWISNLDRNDVGVPLKDINYKDEAGNSLSTNEFQIWMRAIYSSSNPNIHDAIQKGEGIAVKADRGTKFETIHPVLDNLQTIKMNKFSVMTALKTEAD